MWCPVPEVTNLAQQASSNSPPDVALRILSALRLERQIVAAPIVGAPGRVQSQKIFAGAKYIGGKYAVVQAYEDGTIRLYVPRTGDWFEAGVSGSAEDLASCWPRLVLGRACKTGYALTLGTASPGAAGARAKGKGK